MAPSSKPIAAARQRQPSSLSQVQTPPSSKSKKLTKPSRVITLKLESSVLAQFQTARNTPEPMEKKKANKAVSSNSVSSGAVKFESEASSSAQGLEDGKANEATENFDVSGVKAGLKRSLDVDENGDESAGKAQRKRPKV